MEIRVNSSKANGTVTAPPSKSLAHRALICGALSKKSVIENIVFSKDIEATLGCLKTLGAKSEICESEVKIGGLNLENISENTVLYCNESGSTLRFLLPLCMACGKTVILKGTERLFERPLTVYEKIATEQGILFEKGEDYVKVCGRLSAGEYTVKGNISSQFISGLLFLLPLLSTDSILKINGDFESASYVNLTLFMLKKFGTEIVHNGNTFFIKGNQRYADNTYTVEGDCSNAAFLEAFNYIGGKVEVLGINSDTLQGDRVYKEIFVALKNGKKHFDLSDCPDLAPVSFALASVYGGAEFTGTKRLRIKESDRAAAMKDELEKFGIETEIFENSVIIKKGIPKKPSEKLFSHNDHRIAMALTLLLSITGGSLEKAESVEKSYPDYFKTIKGIGIDINEIN